MENQSNIQVMVSVVLIVIFLIGFVCYNQQRFYASKKLKEQETQITKSDMLDALSCI